MSRVSPAAPAWNNRCEMGVYLFEMLDKGDFTRTAALRLRLVHLAEERMLAREIGLAANSAYFRDLELEMGEARDAYTHAAILQLVMLRAELDGPNVG
jgi:hypothetical protein